jgi:hypothetical protein
MALFHVDVAYIKQGKRGEKSAGFATYIAREDVSHGAQYQRYLAREGRDGSDLTATGQGGMPSWVQDASHFWEAADEYERQGGRIARTFQVTLPRELSQEGRLALAEDIRMTYFAHFPHAWAVHTPTGRDGQEQPHVHVIMSERRDDGLVRTSETYFSRAATWDQDPAQHGAFKDQSWNGKRRLYEFRAGLSDLINAALERAGKKVAVSHLSLGEREVGRDPEVDHKRGGSILYAKYHQGIPADITGERRKEIEKLLQRWKETLEERKALQRDYHPEENKWNLHTWEAQKAHAGIRDISREAMVDHIRDHFWRHDRSPAREQERAESLDRAIEREYARTGRDRGVRPAPQTIEQVLQQAMTPLTWVQYREAGYPSEEDRQEARNGRRPPPGPGQERHEQKERRHEPEAHDLDRRWDQPILGNRNSGIYHLPTHKNYGDVGPQNQVRFWTEREAQEAGYRLARNDIGSGAETPLEARERAARERGGRDGRVGRGRGASWGRSHGGEDLAHGGVQVRLERGMER